MSGLRDLRHSVRALTRVPAFTATVVGALALGIGANAAVFTVVNAALIGKLPYADPDRLVAVHLRAPDGSGSGAVPSPALELWKARSRALTAVAAYTIGDLQIASPGGDLIKVPAAFVSPGLLEVLGVTGIEKGRFFGPADAIPNAPPVVIVSHRFWRDRLGARDDLTRLSLPGARRSVVGVLSESFEFPDVSSPDLLVPLLLPGGDVVASLNVLARLAPGTTLATADSDLAALTGASASSFPAAMAPLLAQGAAPEVVTLQRQLAGDLRPVLLVAFGVAGAILLIACANVAALLVARMNGRSRELAIRRALGGTSSQLALLVLTESVVLALAGGAAALLTVWWSAAALRSSLVGVVPHAALIAVDGRVAAFSLVAALAAGLVAAVVPVSQLLLRRWRWDWRAGADPARRFGVRHVAQRMLVVGQVAGAMVLLVGALLLVRTLWSLSEAANGGFEPRNVLTLRVSGSVGAWGRPREATLDEVLDRIRSLPGVALAAATTSFPLDGHGFRFTIFVEGRPEPGQSDRDNTGVDVVSPGYFRTMGIELRAGRVFSSSDASTAPRVAIVNEAFIRSRDLTDVDALGRRIAMGGGPQYADIAIVGVVDDIKDRNPGDNPQPIVYRPFTQAAPNIGWATANLVVRTTSGLTGLSEPVRQAVQAVVPGAAVYDVQSMEHRVAILIRPERQRAIVFGAFGAVGVLLAAVGLYGLLAYLVSQERREYGIRLAIGARAAELAWLVLRRGVVAASTGLVLGLAGAALLTRVLGGMLYGVTATDPATYAAATAVMLAVTMVASYIPARRAMGANPLDVLRSE